MLAFTRIAVVGATGPTGRTLAAELVKRDAPVRVVARRQGTLEALFPEPQIEKRAGDALEAASLAKALAGCDLVVDCIGLPAAQMAYHPVTARNIARYIKGAGARCVQVSSYWAYMPIRQAPLSEKHPREGGPPWARLRRETEDVLREAGAAIVHLPDFFGPYVHTSTVQMALAEAVQGGRMRWIGPADVPRDYAYVPDAMRTVAELLSRDEAYGEDWIVPGCGPVTANQLAALLAKLLGREVRVQAAAPWMLRVVALFNRDMRALMQIVPDYVKPISFDGTKLARLIGRLPRTPYEDALRATVAALRSGQA